MTTYAYPDTQPFKPQSFTAGVRASVLVSTSPLNGAVQTVELLGDRWLFSLEYSPHTLADQSALEAFWFRVRGQVNRVSMWHFGRPIPRGTMRGSPSLGSTAGRGSTTLSINTSDTATMLAGDMLGVGSQLVQVAQDTQANGAGVMTLPITSPLRAQVASGTTLVWDHPTAIFMLSSNETRVAYGVGAVHPGFGVDLVEVWA